MSMQQAPAAPSSPVETVIVPRTRDLGGFSVRRALPAAERRMVGPFVFWDHFGPTVFAPGQGIDVRPHPHIGLATVTYLLDGEIVHRDSLGNAETITPGAVNWMTAGSGIVHSERTGPEQREHGAHLYGLQSWVGLPKRYEETEASFTHYDRDQLPVIDGEGKTLRLVVGALFGKRSPVKTFAETIYADASLAAGARLSIPAEHEERAIYTIEGDVAVAGQRFAPGQLVVLKPGVAIDLKAETAARFVLLGGEPMDGPRHVWWNFVSSSKERIEQAKEDWQAGRFAKVPGDEQEFIPLPA